MTFDEYQKQAATTAIHADHGLLDLAHWGLGLTGESGEIAEKIKKIIRDQDQTLTEETRQMLAKEMGDVLWYLAALADHLGVRLEDVAKANAAKLQDRKQRNVLHGNGDNR